MNTPIPEPTTEQIKQARALGYATVIRQGLASSAVEGVKTAADGLANRAGALVAGYQSRMTKRAAKLEAVYAAIVEPA